MDKESLDFGQVDGPNPCFLCIQISNCQQLLSYWEANIKLFPPLIINPEFLFPKTTSDDFEKKPPEKIG